MFTLINQIVEREASGAQQAAKILAVVLQFGEKNPGMTRVMVGDALVFEHERLIARMNQFFDRVESQLRQSLRAAAEAAGSPHAHRRRQCPGLGADRVRRRPPAALRALGLQAQPDRAPRRRAAPVHGLSARRRDEPRRGRRPHAALAAAEGGLVAGRAHLAGRRCAHRQGRQLPARSACRCRAAPPPRRWTGSAQLIDAHGADRVVFLGDLLHSARGAGAPPRWQPFGRWRERHAGIELVLVRGNHDDRAGDPPAALQRAVCRRTAAARRRHPGSRCATAPAPAAWALCAGRAQPPLHGRRPRHRPPAPAVFSLRRGGRRAAGVRRLHRHAPDRARAGDRVFVVADNAVHALPRYSR